MRIHDPYSDDLDFNDDFAYGKPRALRKLLEGQRREERRNTHVRKTRKKRHQRESWDWYDGDDYDPYVDDNYGQYSRDRYDSY